MTVAFVLFAFFLVPCFCQGGLYLTPDELLRSDEFGRDSRFDPVGSMFVDSGSGFQFNGSGVLISPDWVLATAHQVDANFAPVGNTRFSVGHDFNSPIATSGVSEIVVHPLWRAPGMGTNDLALLRLETPIFAVNPAVRFRGMDPDIPFFNDPNQIEISMAGFGLHGVQHETLVQDSLRRGGSNLLEAYTSGPNRTDLFVEQNPNWSNRPLVDLEWKGTPGDSGGGWFRDINGEQQLVGITWGGFNNWNHPGWSLANRMTVHNAWVDSVTAVPEPSSFISIALATGVFIMRRNRGEKQLCNSLLHN